MILAHEQVGTEYFFFSKGSNGRERNESVSHFNYLQPHF